MNQLEALTNASNSLNLEGLKLHEKYNQDKRKTVARYYLSLHDTTISPVLNYDNMNHFILGYGKAANNYQLLKEQNERLADHLNKVLTVAIQYGVHSDHPTFLAAKAAIQSIK